MLLSIPLGRAVADLLTQRLICCYENKHQGNASLRRYEKSQVLIPLYNSFVEECIGIRDRTTHRILVRFYSVVRTEELVV